MTLACANSKLVDVFTTPDVEEQLGNSLVEILTLKMKFVQYFEAEVWSRFGG